MDNIAENNLDCEPVIENNFTIYFLYAGIGVISLMFIISILRRIRKKKKHDKKQKRSFNLLIQLSKK